MFVDGLLLGLMLGAIGTLAALAVAISYALQAMTRRRKRAHPLTGQAPAVTPARWPDHI
jgi:hypothetical protein